MRGGTWILVLLAIASRLSAQDFTLTVSQESEYPGAAVSAEVTLGNPEAVRGFSFGLMHPEAAVSLVGIRQGAAISTTNGGKGADFFFTDTAPAGGAGGTVNCVISLELPIEEIPPGVDHEIAIFDYEILVSAVPGAEAILAFSGLLGTPPVPVVIDAGGVSHSPLPEQGSVHVLVPPVEDLTCTTDPVSCEVFMSWMNPSSSYQAIEIVENGEPVATVLGDTTSYTHTVEETVILGVFAVGLLQEASPMRVCSAACEPATSPRFLRGDADGNGVFNALVDSLFILGYGFLPGSPEPTCLESADTDSDGVFNGLLDAIHALNFGFIPGSAGIPAPFPDCGVDPAPESTLGCDPNGCP